MAASPFKETTLTILHPLSLWRKKLRLWPCFMPRFGALQSGLTRLLHSPLESPSMPDIVSKGFPPLTQPRVCVFFFHALGSEEGVSHDGSFLGVVTTIIVARLSPRTLLSFWGL